MTNETACDRFQQAHSARIVKLFWIASAMDDSDMKDFIEEMEDDNFSKLFPDLAENAHLEQYRDDGELLQLFVDYKKFGLIAEVNIPECYDFRYDDKNKPVSWSCRMGVCRIAYVYSETLVGLTREVEKISKNIFADYLKNDKKLNKKKVST